MQEPSARPAHPEREALLEQLIDRLATLPSIGRKSAQRLAYHLLSRPLEEVSDFAATVSEARRRIHPCSVCGNHTEFDICRICLNPRRQQNLICVVEKPAEVAAFEKTGSFQGVYHVLGGCLSPLDGIGPGELRLESLFRRVTADGVEIIIALNTNAEGEATATYISQRLVGSKVRITRLARGIPVGSDLEYVDELTMLRALESRVEFQ
jgi:recombination protein RecR